MIESIDFPIRINRYLELKGVATRRGADELIERGLVFVNGQKAVLGYQVKESDQVEVSETDLASRQEKYIYLAFNKPKGLATEDIKINGVFPLGRLDKESEGLILLTNDGRVTDRLLNPKYGQEKEYLVEVREKVSPMHKKILEGGVTSQDEKLKAKNVEIINQHNLAIILTEGQKHEIRRMLNSARLTVVNLKRARVMNVKLGNLALSKSRPLVGAELKNFLTDLGL